MRNADGRRIPGAAPSQGGGVPARRVRLKLRSLTRYRRPVVVASHLLVVALRASTIHAQPVADDEAGAHRGPTWTLASGRSIKLFPGGELFPVYVADPHRPTNAILVNFTRVEIERTRSPRFSLSAGGRFGMLRIDAPTPKGHSWQLSIDAGLDALFDSQNKQDTIGWDGNYGFTVTTASGGPLAFKVAILHVSAHMGDEYAERTEQRRVNYTREELAVGVSGRIARGWRTYVETGVAYVERFDEQEPWRLQAGIDDESRPTLWGDWFFWYWATDLSSMQERNWRVDPTMVVGLAARGEGRTYRLGLQLHDGRPTVGEFFRLSESFVAVGFWVEF